MGMRDQPAERELSRFSSRWEAPPGVPVRVQKKKTYHLINVLCFSSVIYFYAPRPPRRGVSTAMLSWMNYRVEVYGALCMPAAGDALNDTGSSYRSLRHTTYGRKQQQQKKRFHTRRDPERWTFPLRIFKSH